MSLTFFSMVLGVTSDMKKRFLSSGESWSSILTSATRQYVMTKAIPIRKGSTKSLYPDANLSLTSVFLV